MRDPALYPTARHATYTLADREQRLCLALAAMKCMRRPAIPFNMASQRHQVPCLEQAPQERHRGRRPCAGQRLSASLGFKGCALPCSHLQVRPIQIVVETTDMQEKCFSSGTILVLTPLLAGSRMPRLLSLA